MICSGWTVVMIDAHGQLSAVRHSLEDPCGGPLGPAGEALGGCLRPDEGGDAAVYTGVRSALGLELCPDPHTDGLLGLGDGRFGHVAPMPLSST